jgi:hypothetical protein
MYSKNFMKKIGSVALAGVMAASLSIPAFAAADTKTNTETKVTGAYQEIAIAVTVPATGTAQINPYGLPVEFTKSESSTKTTKVSGQQIVTQPLYISNEGDVALDISASVTTGVTGDATIATAALEGTETTKSIYAYLQMVPSANKTLDDTGKDKIIEEFAADATWTTDKVGKLVLPKEDTDAVTADKLATLAASKVTGTGSDATVTYNVGSIVLFRVAGNVVTKPEDDWTAKDGFTATIAYTFTPATTTAEA